MKLETSPKVTKSKRSLHWCRSIGKKICAGFITVSVKKLLHYRAGGLLQYRAFYYIIGQLLHYRAFFITLSGSYYSIGRLLHYRLVQGPTRDNVIRLLVVRVNWTNCIVTSRAISVMMSLETFRSLLATMGKFQTPKANPRTRRHVLVFDQ